MTNSYQNYYDNWNELDLDNQKENPAIHIIANPDKEIFTIIDNGTGIAGDWNDLQNELKKYSEYIPKSHTVKGRSSFGRGMSDVLFRKGIYTNQILSLKNGKCLAANALWKTGKNNRTAPIFRVDDQVSDEKIRSLIPKHGTQVTFHWASKHEKRKFPSKKEMLDKLSLYYELKNVLNDKKVDVFLLYLDGKENPDVKKLSFVNYEKNAEAIGKTLSNIPLSVDKNYDIRIISAKIWRTKNAILDQERGESRTGGLFIEGEYGQIYDLTLFDQEKNYRDASLRIIGEVILSGDAKGYMDNIQNEGITILTRTREGFDRKTTFYKELKKKLESWLIGILESESNSSMSTSSEQFKEAIKKLNEIGKKLLEAKNLEAQLDQDEPGEKPEPPKSELPDTIVFSPESPKIEQGVLCKIFLNINCEKIKPETKIIFKVEGLDKTHFEVNWETSRVPKPNKKGLAKIPIFVKCNELLATAEIIAQTEKKNGELTGEKYCFLKCVEEKEGPDKPELTEYLEFVPKKTKVDTNVDKRVNIMAHQILDPGTKIKINFTCETHDFEPPITFAEDGNKKITGASHSFEVEVPNVPLDENAYRKIPLTFTGTGEGLRGKITASAEHESTTPTTCEIEIESISESGGGLLSGWDIRDVPNYGRYSWYNPKDTKVVINVGVPFVRKLLGKNKSEAEIRCEKLPETQVFVAQTMMEEFFDEIVIRQIEARLLVIPIELPTERDIHEFCNFEKQKIMKIYGEEILSIFAPNIRKKAAGGDVTYINFKNEGLEFKYWDLDLQQNVIPPISFNELKEFRGMPANLSTVHFEVNGQEFEVAVYQFDGDKFAVTLHNYDKDGKYKVVMPEIDRYRQIFRPTGKISSKITLEDPVFSTVKITCWVGEPEKRTRVVPLRYDQYHLIPDTPEMNHSNVIIEISPNWQNREGESLVQYAKYSDMSSNTDITTSKNFLVSLISKRQTIEMAKAFVRTKVVPAFVSVNEIVKKFKDITANCQTNTCDTTASGPTEILTKFGVYFDGKIPKPRETCKKCK